MQRGQRLRFDALWDWYLLFSHAFADTGMNHHLLLKQFEHLNHQNPDTFESRDLDMLIKAVRVCPQVGSWCSLEDLNLTDKLNGGNTTSVGSGERASSEEGCLSFLTADNITSMGVHGSSMSPNPKCCQLWTRLELASHNGICSFYLDLVRKSCLWRFYGRISFLCQLFPTISWHEEVWLKSLPPSPFGLTPWALKFGKYLKYFITSIFILYMIYLYNIYYYYIIIVLLCIIFVCGARSVTQDFIHVRECWEYWYELPHLASPGGFKLEFGDPL